MDRRYGLFPPAALVWALLPCIGWGAPQKHAAPAIQIKALKVECNASSSTVRTGQSITLTAQAEGASTGLTYSFSTNGGKLYSNGSTARLDTAGVPVGTVITATCQAIDGLGRRSSGNVAVRIVSVDLPHDLSHVTQTAAPHPPTGGAVHQPPKELSASTIHRAEGAQQTAAKQAATAAAQAPPQAAAAAPEPSGGEQTTGNAGGSDGSPAGPAPAPASVGDGDVYQQAEQVQQWKNQLKNGKIDYLIPSQMKLHETSVVKVVVHGFADTAQGMAGATTSTLKVSPRMQVQLSAEENPDEFDIDPKVGEIQFVPIDGSATWMWKVMPKQPAENQTLTIRALLVYPDKGEQTEQEITSYTARVTVSVPGFWASLEEAFWDDPAAAMKYVLPGGAGFTAIAGLVVWLWRRRHPADAKTDKEPSDA